MKLTMEQENLLTKLCFEEKSNKEIAEALGVKLSDVHAARSRLGITIPKVKAMIGQEPSIRTKEDIETEIFKVSNALKEALKKSARCRERLEQLQKELEAAK